MTESCYDINDNSAVPNSDLLYMQQLYNMGTVAIVKTRMTSINVVSSVCYRIRLVVYMRTSRSKGGVEGNAAMIEDAEYTVIDKLNGFLYFSIGNKLYTYRKGIDECVEVNLQGVNFDPIVSLNVIAHNDYKANIFVATYSETNKG